LGSGLWRRPERFAFARVPADLEGERRACLGLIVKMRKAQKSGVKRAPAVPRRSEQLKVVYSSPRIEKRVRQIAKQISADYRGKTVHLVAVLENCFMFVADLIRRLNVPVVCHFLNVRMQDSSVEGIPVREIKYTPELDLSGQDVLLVNGVLYSGVTLDYLYRYLLAQGPRSLRTATLVEKVEERKVDMAIDYLGFQTSGKFLVGYGLGDQGKYHNLTYIAARGPEEPGGGSRKVQRRI
jgi:hypoxanthine phosphoribosyltransferase